MNIITTGIDENPHYWDLLLAFLASIEENSPGTKVIVNLINIGFHENLYLHNFSCVISVNYCENHGSPYQKNYMRHQWIPDIMEAHSHAVAWVDPDCLIRKPIDDMFCDVTDTGIKYFHKHGKKEKHQLQGGVYVLGNSKRTIEYCDEIFRKLKGTDDWMLPQTLMLRQIKKSGLKRFNLPESYNDSKFKDESFIWHCKHAGFANVKFQKEFRKYLEIGKNIIDNCNRN